MFMCETGKMQNRTGLLACLQHLRFVLLIITPTTRNFLLFLFTQFPSLFFSYSCKVSVWSFFALAKVQMASSSTSGMQVHKVVAPCDKQFLCCYVHRLSPHPAYASLTFLVVRAVQAVTMRTQRNTTKRRRYTSTSHLKLDRITASPLNVSLFLSFCLLHAVLWSGTCFVAVSHSRIRNQRRRKSRRKTRNIRSRRNLRRRSALHRADPGWP